MDLDILVIPSAFFLFGHQKCSNDLTHIRLLQIRPARKTNTFLSFVNTGCEHLSVQYRPLLLSVTFLKYTAGLLQRVSSSVAYRLCKHFDE